MKIVLVEDEQLAIEHLEVLIKKYDEDIEIIATLSSVKHTVEWFQENKAPDLAFFDIQLSDGSSFEIFDQIKIQCPIIFATAYHEYTLKAFKVNSIDYILKPYDLEEISSAMEKYAQLKQNFSVKQEAHFYAIRTTLQMLQKEYKTRFLVKSGQQLISVQSEEISCFYHESKIVWIKTNQDKKFAVDYTLDQLENLLHPKHFFRINRKFIIHYTAIQKVINYTNSRLKIKVLNVEEDQDIVVSRERVNDFKMWLDG